MLLLQNLLYYFVHKAILLTIEAILFYKNISKNNL